MNPFYSLILFAFFMMGTLTGTASDKIKSVHNDTPFRQDYSIKYYFDQPDVLLKKVAADRNGKIQVLSSEGLLHPYAGAFLYPGTMEKDMTHRPFANKNIADIVVYKEQLVYLDDEVVLSNSWAGELFSKHNMPEAQFFAAGQDFTFLISAGRNLKLIKDSEEIWHGETSYPVLELKFDPATGNFRILTANVLYTFSPERKELITFFKGSGFTSFDIADINKLIIIGTLNGYIEINNLTHQQNIEVKSKLPVPEITVVKEINGNIWFGSPEGAFMLRKDGKYNYYFSERWLPGNRVTDIAEGPENSVLFLTGKGLGQVESGIC